LLDVICIDDCLRPKERSAEIQPADSDGVHTFNVFNELASKNVANVSFNDNLDVQLHNELARLSAIDATVIKKNFVGQPTAKQAELA
jgi:hypothetical protein